MMKKVYLAGVAAMLVFASCSESGGNDSDTDSDYVDSDALDIRLEDSDDIERAAISFGQGGATNGEEYFSGLLAEVVEVDVKLREVTSLDNMDASEEEIMKVLDSTLSKVEKGRASIQLYTDKSWPKRAEFHDLTVEWFDAVDGLVNDYLYDLAEPMSRPDDSWTDEEYEFYEEYVVALKAYYEIDNRWVEFQYEYADANGFEISGTIDEDSMVEEAISNDVE